MALPILRRVPPVFDATQRPTANPCATHWTLAWPGHRLRVLGLLWLSVSGEGKGASVGGKQPTRHEEEGR